MDASTESTLQSFINCQNLDNDIRYCDLCIFEKSIDGTQLLNTANVLNDYRDELLEVSLDVNLSNEEYLKYRYKPKSLALYLYGSTEYYYIILFLNQMASPKEFNRRRIKLIKRNDLSIVLSSIASAEDKYVSENKAMHEKFKNEEYNKYEG